MGIPLLNTTTSSYRRSRQLFSVVVTKQMQLEVLIHTLLLNYRNITSSHRISQTTLLQDSNSCMGNRLPQRTKEELCNSNSNSSSSSILLVLKAMGTTLQPNKLVNSSSS